MAQDPTRRAPDQERQGRLLDPDSHHDQDALQAAEILCTLQLRGREVLLDVHRGGLDQAAWPEYIGRRGGGRHRYDERKRQPRTPHLPTL